MSKYLIGSVEELIELGKNNFEKYDTASPFPHSFFDNVFNPEILDAVLEEFPDLSKQVSFNDTNQVKLASTGEYRFGPRTKEFLHFLNSQPFLDFLTALTGIKNLIPDPYFAGAGLHQIKPGGFLKIHADFNKHAQTGLDRRLNVLIYLNKDWKEEYGGHFELWNRDMTKGEVKLLPVYNRMAMFSTTSTTYHGHPDPLKCPEDRSRKSIALYYYTNGRPEEEIMEGVTSHSTIFRARAANEEGTKMETGYFDQLKGKEEAHKRVMFLKKFIPPILIDIKKALFN